MWTVLVLSTIILWALTDIFYKKGASKEDKYIHLRFSIIIGIIFFIIALVYLIIRDEPVSIFKSAITFWPMTLFAILYPIVNTISYKGFVYNDASVVAPVENTANGTSVVILVIVYLLLGRASSIWEILTPFKIIGIVLILVGLILLSINKHKKAKEKGIKENFKGGASALLFPLLFSLIDGIETVVSGLCLDKTFGYAMPEGDSIIIVGLIYAIYAFGFWIYLSIKERKVFNPVQKSTLPFIYGALCDNIAIVLYSYAMALDSVATDPILAAYPVICVLLSRIWLKEKIPLKQYLCIGLMLVGSIIIVIGQNV